MRSIKKFIQIPAMSILCLIFMHGTVFAAGSVKITGYADTCSVGDEYMVSVSADNPEDASVAPEISITYDPRRLEFIECSTSYGGGGGGLITINETDADITFAVLSGGTAVVDVSAVFDGNGADAKTASVSLSVDGEDTAGDDEDAENADLGIEGGSIASGDGSKLVSTVFADEFMPRGFYKTTVTYNEQLVEAAQFDMGNIVLLYVTDENGNNGNFNVYDQSTGELSDFLQISGIENKFIIVLRAEDAEGEIPEGFVLATLMWNGQKLDAYSYDGISDFFLLYAVSSEGNKGWYLYDQTEGTYQRYVEELYRGSSVKDNKRSIDTDEIAVSDETDEETESDEKEDKKADKKADKPNTKVLIIILVAAVLIGLLIFAVTMLVRMKDESELEGGGDDGFNAPYKDSYDFNEKKLKASDIASREMNSTGMDMPKTDNIYEKYRAMDEANKAAAANEMTAEPMPVDEEKLSKADEKARKKAEKKMKKEYGEFGPADFSKWQEAVRDDRKVSEEELRGAVAPKDMHSAQNNAEIPAMRPQSPIKQPSQDDIKAANNAAEKKLEQLLSQDATEPEKQEKTHAIPASMNLRKDKPDNKKIKNIEDPADIKKDSYVKMMKKLPANDRNEPVQPKPVQQFDLDDDFEFEYLNLDDE